MAEIEPQPPIPPELLAARAAATLQWRRLGNRLLGITPRGVARALLLLLAAGAIVWLFVASWPALLPFVVGGAIAYLVLPAVNRLERVLPRPVAAVLMTVFVVALMAAAIFLIVRPLVIELNNAWDGVPTHEDISNWTADLDAELEGWPAPVRDFVRSELQQGAVDARDRFDRWIQNLDSIAFDMLLGLVNAVALVIGLLVLPVWLLLVLRDQKRAVDVINRQLPDWMEADFWAVARILDRALGVYLRGLVLFGAAVGAGYFTMLLVVDRWGGVELARYPLAVAVFIAIMELVPAIGPLLALVVLSLAAWRAEDAPAIVLAVAIYLGVRWMARQFVTARIERKVIDLPPAILVLVLVALSQFGLLWALLAVPIAACSRDLFRYAWGRLSTPARPAGLLPGEPLPVGRMPATTSAAVARTPVVYQRRRARVAAVEPAPQVGEGIYEQWS